MKIKHSNNKKTLALVSIGILLLIGAGLLYYLISHNNSKSESNTVAEQEKAGTEIKNKSIRNAEAKENSTSGSDQPEAPTPQPGAKNKVEVTITATNQTDNQLQIRALISAIDAQGSCSLKMQNASVVITKTAPTQNFANSSTCQGFDIDRSELTAGIWETTITYDGAQLQGSATRSITVK